MSYYNVVHEEFQTDRTGFTTTVVEAADDKAARELFNRAAAKRRDYPFMWGDARSISPLVPLTEADVLAIEAGEGG